MSGAVKSLIRPKISFNTTKRNDDQTTSRPADDRQDHSTESMREAEKDVVPPVYVGGARILNWGHGPRTGMTIKLMLKDIGPREVHPFKGMRWGKANGQRLKTWIGPYSELIELSQLDELESVYAGETLLTYWGETCTDGIVLQVMLDSGPDGTNDTHPFKDLPWGRVEGADLYVSFWAINDDESIIPKKAAVGRTPFHQLNEVRQSNTVVNDPEFVNFLETRIDRLVNAAPSVSIYESPKKWAEEVVRLYLGVHSRSVMNEENLDGLEARRKWKILLSEYLQSDEFNARRMAFTGRK